MATKRVSHLFGGSFQLLRGTAFIVHSLSTLPSLHALPFTLEVWTLSLLSVQPTRNTHIHQLTSNTCKLAMGVSRAYELVGKYYTPDAVDPKTMRSKSILT